MSLTTHSRVSEERVLAVPEPEWTHSWHPISHVRCLNVLSTAVDQFKLNVVKKEYSLSNDGFKFFGSWTLGNGGNEVELSQSIVFRNSLNKQFPFGLAAGTHAWACDNLCFRGEFMEFRRHTSGMDDNELERVISNGMEIILPKMQKFQDWHRGLHEVKLIPSKMRELCYDAVVQEVIPRRQINEFDNLLFGSVDFSGDYTESKYNSRELFGFHGACTQIYRDKSMTVTNNKQKELFEFISNKYGKFLPIFN